MNRLPIEKRAQIIGMQVEGMSMRAVSRVAGVSINTVTKLLEDVGTACALYQERALNILQGKRIECDEIWSFCDSKGKTSRLKIRVRISAHHRRRFSLIVDAVSAPT